MAEPSVTTTGERAIRPRTGLIVSMVVTAAFGALGIVWGLASGSQLILFTGVYSFIGVGTSWLLMQADAMADAGPSKRYPYGREAAVPLVIGVQGVALLSSLAYASFEAVSSILDGGADVSTGVALTYGVLSLVASVIVFVWLRRGVGESEILLAEAAAWRVAVWQGVGMVLGFGAMGLLTGSAWEEAARYVDPVMVLVTFVFLVPTPLRMIRTTIVELLEGAPDAEVQEPVLAAVAAVREQFGLAEPTVRMTKSGPKVYVEVDAVVGPHVTVGEEDQVRHALWDRLTASLPYDLWLNVELSTDPTWGR